jgi:two-component system LytT family response regulator
MPEIRILIVDDEPLARQFVRGVLADVPKVQVVGECADGVAAVREIRRQTPDLVLLDVQMPEVSGFDVIERIGAEAMPEVIFVTAHEEYTLRAFEVHALDYVVKPFDPARLQSSVEHARNRIPPPGERDFTLADRLDSLLEGRDGPTLARYAKRLMVRHGKQVQFVPLEEVRWLEAARNNVRLHVEKEVHTVRTSLKGLLPLLDPTSFVRVHRSAVVNLDWIREVQPWFGGEYVVVLVSGEKLRVSRTYRDRLLKLAH